jgi:hypothetical protein
MSTTDDRNMKKDCPHCNEPMLKWWAASNEFGDGMGFCTDILLVCFNNDCPMFVKGWNSLYDKFGRVGSVRYYFDPSDGISGVLPVAYKDALRGDIVTD